MPPANMDPLATPRAASKHNQRTRRTRREKEAVLEMFDLGLADQLARIDQAHEAKMSLFLARQSTEISRIPLAIRKMTVGELGKHWREDGLRGVMQRLAEVKIGASAGAKRDADGDLEEEMREGAAAKRKRTVTASTDGSTDRPSAKTARTGLAVLKTPKVRKKKTVGNTTAQPTASTSTSVPTAETFQFHPLLPSTPLLKSTASGYRKPRRNESIVMSLNGSPLRLDDLLKRMGIKAVPADAKRGGPASGKGARTEEETEEEEEEVEEEDEPAEEEDGLDLLDEEEMMRQMEDAKGMGRA